jgi:hypothetical protein
MRIAQHYVQVVGEQQQDGELQVRRLYADVLVSNVTPEPGDIEGEASNTLSLTGEALGARDLPVSSSHTLSLVSLGGRAVTADGFDILSLSQLVPHFNLVDDRKPVYNTLGLIQTVTTLSSLDTEHDLGLIQTVNVLTPIKPVVTSVLGLSQHISTPHRKYLLHDLNLSHSIPTPLTPQIVSDTLNFTHDSPIGLISDILSFTQFVGFGFFHAITQNLGITDNLHLQADWVRSAEHTDILGHALTWYEDTSCGRKQYTPFQGENTIPTTVETPRNDLQDPQGDTGNFSVYQPYIGVPMRKVTMRKPELDNRDRNSYTRINQETRGGKIIVYADPDWPKVRTLAVTIIGLIETKVDELHTFMQDTVGQEIGLTDWEGRLWKGFITNPNEVATQDGRGMWTTTFEFQGELLEVEQPGNEEGNGMAMNLSQSVTGVIV